MTGNRKGKAIRVIAFCIGVFTVLLAGTNRWLPAQQREAQGPQVSTDVRHDTSAPLLQMPIPPARPALDRVIQLRFPTHLFARPKPGEEDPLSQVPIGTTPAPSPATFEGISDDDNAAVLGYRVVPPDTNGDVGPNHYVQTVNGLLAVYTKTGTRLLGPLPINSFWSGFGGICETNNDGDPVVLYDPLAGRWMISQFALGRDGHQCIAVSTSGDPTGSYYRYDFIVSPGGTNDYPKLGVWPDGYYLTANDFGSSFRGAIAVAFERNAMLTGASAQMVKFGPLSCGAECFFSLQPSDLDGSAPPAGTPNTFVQAWDDETWGTGTKSDGYRLWNFTVNWTTPLNSTFTALPQVNAPEFDSNLCNYSPCVPQPSPGERLDTLSQFTMYPAQYRYFSGTGAHGSLLVNHTVDVNGRNRAGIRWAELQNSGSGWTLNQTGTYSPDSTHRWMGSIAMDKNGNIALGYSVSSRSVRPSIRYAVHSASDPLGAMGTEATLQAGVGSQTSSYNRWGDYSRMSVDPDGCTFYYTNEYYANNGSFDWKTRVGSFRMLGCF